MVAARLETGQQALLQEITVRVAPRLSLSARSRMTALPLSQSRHVMTEDEAEGKREQEIDSLIEYFINHLEIDEELARVLVEEGFTSLEELAYVPIEEMLEIEEFDEDLIEELRARAKDELLNLAIASEEVLDGAQPAEDLLEMDGMDRHLAFILASRGIVTMEDLAEQSIDDLKDIEDVDEERAAALIMTARAPWFVNHANPNVNVSVRTMMSAFIAKVRRSAVGSRTRARWFVIVGKRFSVMTTPAITAITSAMTVAAATPATSQPNPTTKTRSSRILVPFSSSCSPSTARVACVPSSRPSIARCARKNGAPQIRTRKYSRPALSTAALPSAIPKARPASGSRQSNMTAPITSPSRNARNTVACSSPSSPAPDACATRAVVPIRRNEKPQ